MPSSPPPLVPCSIINARPHSLSARARDSGLEHLTVSQLRMALDGLGVRHIDCLEKKELVARLRVACQAKTKSREQQ